MTRTMKASQWDPAQGKIVVNVVSIPEPGEGQFLIKIASASLCHSDLMSIAIPGRSEPITLGHEGAGYVHKVHPSVANKGFAVGDAVGFLYVQGGCYECEGCLIHNNHCFGKTSKVNGFDIPGFFAEYAVVDMQNCILLPLQLDVKLASPYFCAGVTAFHCVDSCELEPNDWLVVVGCGGLGQLAIQYAKAMGARVIGIDVNDSALANSRVQGADLTFNSMADPAYKEKILQTTGRGAHAVVVFSAAEAAYESATPLIKCGGILMVAGLPRNGVRLDALDVATGKFRVKGDSTSIPQRMPKAIEFTARHNIKPEVEVYKSLDAVSGMVERLRAGESTKRMVVSF